MILAKYVYLDSLMTVAAKMYLFFTTLLMQIAYICWFCPARRKREPPDIIVPASRVMIFPEGDSTRFEVFGDEIAKHSDTERNQESHHETTKSYQFFLRGNRSEDLLGKSEDS